MRKREEVKCTVLTKLVAETVSFHLIVCLNVGHHPKVDVAVLFNLLNKRNFMLRNFGNFSG